MSLWISRKSDVCFKAGSGTEARWVERKVVSQADVGVKPLL